MMAALGWIVIAVVAGFGLLMIGFLLFMRSWSRQEEARQRLRQAERITHQRLQHTHRPQPYRAMASRQQNADAQRGDGR